MSQCYIFVCWNLQAGGLVLLVKINDFRHSYILCIMWKTFFRAWIWTRQRVCFLWSLWSLPVKSRRIWDVGHSTFDRDFSFFSSKWIVCINNKILCKYTIQNFPKHLHTNKRVSIKNRGKYINSWVQPRVVIPQKFKSMPSAAGFSSKGNYKYL